MDLFVKYAQMGFLKHNNVIPKDGINVKANTLNLKNRKNEKRVTNIYVGYNVQLYNGFVQ